MSEREARITQPTTDPDEDAIAARAAQIEAQMDAEGDTGPRAVGFARVLAEMEAAGDIAFVPEDDSPPEPWEVEAAIAYGVEASSEARADRPPEPPTLDVAQSLTALRDENDPDEVPHCVDCGVEVDGLGPPICRECADVDD